MGLTHYPLPIHFLQPAWLLALPVVLVLAIWLRRSARREGNWSQIVDSRLLPLLRLRENRHGASDRWPSPPLVLGIAWTMAILALAGPAWTRLQTPAFRDRSAWVLVLDLSPSMGAGDVAPNRVTRARYAATDLLSAVHDARVGLVVFAGEAHTVAPLTTDVATVRMLVKALTPGLMPEAGDRLAPALEEAQHLLHADAALHGQVIVLTDGFADPAQALRTAHELRQQGTTVNIVGIGNQIGAPEPDGHGGFVRDPTGRPRLTRLQSDELRRVATAGGGRFVLVNELATLSAQLESDAASGPGEHAQATHAQLATWRNEGIWLLPPLLLLAALLARRGWL